jgi:hypothetical protein
MATICALCDAGFPTRRDDCEANPPQVQTAPPVVAVLMPLPVRREIERLAKEHKDEQQSDSGTVLPTR